MRVLSLIAFRMFSIDGQIRLVGHRHVPVAQDTAVDPVHFKGRRYRNDLFSLLAEGLQEIADSHVGTVGGQDILVLCADEFRVFMQKSVRLRVNGQEFRRNLLQHGIHEFLRQSLRVLVHVVAVQAVAVLHREYPDGVLYMFVYVIIHILTSIYLYLTALYQAAQAPFR